MICFFESTPQYCGQAHRNNGTILLYSTAAILAVLAVLSLAVDYGRVQMTKTELQRCADAAARAGASGLEIGPSEAILRATSYASLNPVNGKMVILSPEDIVLGHYNPQDHSFTPAAPSQYAEANAVQVNIRLTGEHGVPLMLASILGKKVFEVTASSTSCISGGDDPPYIGLNLTRMYNNTRFDGYSSSLGVYGPNNIRTDQTIYGARNLLLDGNAHVIGKAKYGPTGTLTKSASAIVTGGITRNSEQITRPPVALGNVKHVNDNVNLASRLSSKGKLKIPNNDTITFPGGTYYLTELEIGQNASVYFSGDTTIYLDGPASISGTIAHSTLRPALLKVNVANGHNVSIINNGRFYGRLYNPQGDVHHHNSGQSFGSVISSLLCFRNNAQGHADFNAMYGDGSGGGIKMIR